jgi:hypothetical protein
VKTVPLRTRTATRCKHHATGYLTTLKFEVGVTKAPWDAGGLKFCMATDLESYTVLIRYYIKNIKI